MKKNLKNFKKSHHRLPKNSFDADFYINTKGKNDLVIHTDKTAASPVGVIIETKSISNSVEMVSAKN
jgi:hypothetical protein